MSDLEDYVRTQNIERFRALIMSETDPARRRRLQTLLERELKMRRAQRPESEKPQGQ